MAVDTACSSSLVSLHCAVNWLARTQHGSAFNCGVNVTLDPLAPLVLKAAGMLAADGRCKVGMNSTPY